MYYYYILHRREIDFKLNNILASVVNEIFSIYFWHKGLQNRYNKTEYKSTSDNFKEKTL